MRKTAWTLARDTGIPPVRAVDASELAALGERDMLAELAWEGQRVLACRSGDDARLFGSGMRDWTEPFAALAAALRKLAPSDVVLLAHVCVLDERSRPSFGMLKDWVGGKRAGTLVLAISDVARIGDEDLRQLPLSERRAKLTALLQGAPEPLVLSQPLSGALGDLRASLAKMGLPGMWLRARASLYPPDEDEWLAVSADDAPLPEERTLSPSPRVTNADKVLYPRDGFTKTDVVAYYAAIAPALLAHMRDRPIVAQRWPDGIDDFTWYQHRVPPRAPDYLEPVMIEGNRRIVIGGSDALLWMVNQAALTLHGWSTRVGSLEAPDWVVLDLDPGESTKWKDVIDVALAVRRLLELLEVSSVVKTSGKKGLHILVPVAPGQTMALAQTFAQNVALLVSRLMPKVVTLENEIDKRSGRLFFDHLNFKGKSLVLPYSLRDADKAPVSAPIEWSEVTERLDPRAFTLATMRARLDAKGDLFAPALSGTTDLKSVIAKMI